MMMWTKMHDTSKSIGVGLALIAVGALAQSVIDKSDKIPSLQTKAAKLEVVEKVELPKLKDVAGCQTARARVATAEAVSSESGKDINLKDIPNCPLPTPEKKASVPSVKQ